MIVTRTLRMERVGMYLSIAVTGRSFRDEVFMVLRERWARSVG